MLSSINYSLVIVAYLLLIVAGCKNEDKKHELERAEHFKQEYLKLLDEYANLENKDKDVMQVSISSFLSKDSIAVSELKQVIEFHKKINLNDKETNELLKLIDEPNIKTDTTTHKIYRFSWTGAFSLNGIILRLHYYNSDSILLFYKKIRIDTFPKIPDFKAKILLENVRVISEDEFHHFEHKLRMAYFWDITRDLNDTGTDGSMWSMECKYNKYNYNYPKYHIVSRHSPRDNTFRSSCEYLLSLCKEHFSDMEGY